MPETFFSVHVAVNPLGSSSIGVTPPVPLQGYPSPPMLEHPTILKMAPAKLNLALSVGPPNGQGLHPICSWMVTVDLSDELLVTRLEPDRLSRYAILWHPEAKRQTEIDWSITTDLAVRAHLALEAHVERRLPVQLKLEKRIPVGGGLGGGSSDAATMLLALNELFELGLSSAELAEIGAVWARTCRT